MLVFVQHVGLQVKGGSHNHRPKDYIRRQWKYNTVHKDGSIEKDEEDALWFVDRMREHIEGCPRRILDLGSRTGYASRKLQGHYPEAFIVSFDIVPTVSVAPIPIAGDAHYLPFKDRIFDWTFACAIIEHFWNVELGADEMMRVSKALYVVADVEEDFGNPSHFACTQHHEEWAELFDVAGWNLKKVEPLLEGRAVEIICERD